MNNNDLLKIKAVLLYLVNKFDKEVDYIKVFKLLYLSQKEHLRLYGLPIIKDDFIAFKAGPAPSKTYEICRVANKDYENSDMQDYASSIEIIVKNGKNGEIKYIKAKEAADLKRLSKSNIKVIDYIFNEFSSYPSSKLSTISHDKAWAMNWDEKNQSCHKIPINDILATLNLKPQVEEYIKDSIMLSGMRID